MTNINIHIPSLVENIRIVESFVDNAKDKKPSLASKKLLKMRQTLAKRKVKVGKTANGTIYSTFNNN